jgi:DnaJ-class molecular chaperone
VQGMKGKRTGFKNYYKVLGLSTRASQEEIEHAYNKMIKEAHFDRSKNRKEIEIAFLVLTDVAHKAMHDAVIDQDEKEMEITAKIQKKKEKKITVQQLAKIAVGLFVIAVFYFFFRFGYHLKSFSPGDAIYYKSSDSLLGTVVDVESDHDFGRTRMDAYKIKDSHGKILWIPQTDVKSSCYKR